MWAGAWDGAWGGAPALLDNKAILVDRIKEWQRQSPAHKRSWDSYCMQKGIAKFDPSKKEESFLQGFLDLADAGLVILEDPGANDDQGEKAALVDAVKQWQRQGAGHKQSWWNYCNSRGTRDYDPARHDVASLQKFISGVEAGTIKPDENAEEKGGGKGEGESKGSKGKGSGKGVGGLGKGEMMMMMMGMMMKGMMKGKGGGCGCCGGGAAPSCGKGGGSPTAKVGEIRYDDPLHAQAAIQSLNGSSLSGGTITVAYDQSSMDGTKLIVTGVPQAVQWQELKDHFKGLGTVAFAGFKSAPPPGTGGGWDWDDSAWGGGGYGPMWGGKGKGWSPY